MIVENLKQNLIDYAHALTLYDYAAFGWLAFLFLIFLTLAILLGRRRPTLAIFIILITILLMFVAPFGIKYFLDQTVRRIDVVTDKVTKLYFASSLIITGHLQNKGKVAYHTCRIHAKVFKVSDNQYKNMLYPFKPLRNKIVTLDQNISPGEEAAFKISFEHFTYSKEYNISLEGVCY